MRRRRRRRRRRTRMIMMKMVRMKYQSILMKSQKRRLHNINHKKMNNCQMMRMTITPLIYH